MNENNAKGGVSPPGTPFEEALTKTGNGLYNGLLVATCALNLLAIGMELLAFPLVVNAACDLHLTVEQKGILTSLPFIGIFLGAYPWGYISDTCGRKFTLLVSLSIGFVVSSLGSLSTHWLMLGVSKLLSNFFMCAANSTTYTLVGESCAQRVRSKYMLMMTCLLILSPAMGAVLTYPTLKLDFAVDIPLLGIVFRPWRLLIIVIALPAGIGAILISFLYESPKFLANLGRQDEALQVMKNIYAVNHRSDKDGYKVTSLIFEEVSAKRHSSIIKRMYEQSAPLFRPPLLSRTIQLFFLIFVAYITNNSFLIWLPHILDLVRLALDSNDTSIGNVCSVISYGRGDVDHLKNTTDILDIRNSTLPAKAIPVPTTCTGNIAENVLITMIVSQSVFSLMTFAIAYLPRRRKAVLVSVLCISSLSGLCINIIHQPIASVLFFVMLTSTCLTMGILASYFVDLYPTSYRGMISCLSIMVGRTSGFIGINIVGNVIFNHCQITFYLWSLMVFSSVLVAWFLPPDMPATKSTS